MYKLRKVGKFNVFQLKGVADILNACGKDMAKKYDLHHWDNPYLKTFAIVCICTLKNEIYLLYDNSMPVATFMTKISGNALHFEKLGTKPSEAGKGVGSLCMKQIEEIASKTGCSKVVMEVYEPSQHAVSFYEHRGYVVVGTKDTLKYKEVKMEKSIL